MKTINPQNLYKYFFYIFLFLIPFQARKVFLTEHSFYTGAFTEHGTIFLYASDIFLLLSTLSLLIFNKHLIKKGLLELKNKSEQNKTIFLILVLCAWFFVDTLLKRDFWEISLFRSVKMSEMLLLVILAITLFRKKHFLISSLYIIIISAFFQSIIAIYQFIYQKSLFLFPLLHKFSGETILSPNEAGVAKIVLENGEKMIRGYGTLPHPNILGGFLVFSILVSVFLYQEHKYHILSSRIFSKIKQNKHKKALNSIFWILIFTSQFTALALSFSRSAWVALLFSSLTLIIFSYKPRNIVSRETIRKLLVKRHEILLSLLFLAMIIINNNQLFLNRIKQDIVISKTNNIVQNLPQNSTFNDRKFFNNVSRETINKNLLTGSAPGTFVFQIKSLATEQDRETTMEPWQFQPAHNIFLLITSETGIIGLFIFLLIIVKIISHSLKNIVSRETIREEKYLKVILLSTLSGFMLIGAFDHYLLTFQQGQLLLWTTIGLLLTKTNIEKAKNNSSKDSQ